MPLGELSCEKKTVTAAHRIYFSVYTRIILIQACWAAEYKCKMRRREEGFIIITIDDDAESAMIGQIWEGRYANF